MTDKDEDLDTSSADAAIVRQRLARTRLGALVKLVEQSMDAPGGTAWEEEIFTPETPEPAGEDPPKSEPMQERERRWREEFSRNWPDKPGKK